MHADVDKKHPQQDELKVIWSICQSAFSIQGVVTSIAEDPGASHTDNSIKSEDKARTSQGPQCAEFAHAPDLGFTRDQPEARFALEQRKFEASHPNGGWRSGDILW